MQGGGAFGREDYATAALADGGRFALAYLPSPRTVAIDLARMPGRRVVAWWYSPRDGKTYDGRGGLTGEPFGAYPCDGRREFTPPAGGREDDWVLVLDDAARPSPRPGIGSAQTR
jgi:hypothetical protein